MKILLFGCRSIREAEIIFHLTFFILPFFKKSFSSDLRLVPSTQADESVFQNEVLSKWQMKNVKCQMENDRLNPSNQTSTLHQLINWRPAYSQGIAL